MTVPETVALDQLLVVPPSHGASLKAFGEEIFVKLGAHQTNGTLSIWINVTQPGGGPPEHYHLDEDELFIVQEGRVSFCLDGQWTEQPPGSVVYVPRGALHTFRNVGDAPSRQWTLTTPGGFERFFARCAAEFERPAGPAKDRVVAISAEHGIHFAEPIPA